MSSLISARLSLLAASPRSVPQNESSSAIFSSPTSGPAAAAAAAACRHVGHEAGAAGVVGQT